MASCFVIYFEGGEDYLFPCTADVAPTHFLPQSFLSLKMLSHYIYNFCPMRWRKKSGIPQFVRHFFYLDFFLANNSHTPRQAVCSLFVPCNLHIVFYSTAKRIPLLFFPCKVNVKRGNIQTMQRKIEKKDLTSIVLPPYSAVPVSPLVQDAPPASPCLTFC